MSKETFKEFVKTKPELADYVKDNTMTWQKFYELYDLYGEDNEIWSKYATSKSQTKVTDFIKKFDPDTFQHHIETAQKALDIFSELATKTTDTKNPIPPNVERPITKFFGD
ncbi:MAG: spore coat protein YlbD [Candidatus Coprovivens sp.]